MDPIRHDARQHPDGPRFLLHHAIPVPPGRLLLDERSGSERQMHAGRRHHQRDLRVLGAEHPL